MSVIAACIKAPARFLSVFAGGLLIATSASETQNVYPEEVYWGDTHEHTSNSMDAGRYTLLVGPEEAYRFARGEKVRSDEGTVVQLTRPLDFLVVADHSENIGFWNGLRANDPLLMESELGRAYLAQQSGKKKGARSPFRTSKSVEFTRSVWEKNCEIADNLNQPGIFTALIGYEWTSMPQGNNLHRVVIYKDGAKQATQVIPYTNLESENPEDLWKHMSEYEATTGGKILAIPHNGNMSNGLMFTPETYEGKPLTRSDAAFRSRWEPLIEITQIKGVAEAHPTLSPNDEFADHRIWDIGNMGAKQKNAGAGAKEDWMLPYEYARSALKLGLDLESRLGANPFKFGVIGSTDGHTGLTTLWHDSPIAKRIVTEEIPEGATLNRRVPSRENQNIWEQTMGGIAGVWASENTRSGLFEAMVRKEVYASTGPRIRVRFFGGWDYKKRDAQRTDLAKTGYVKGVAMGGDLTSAPQGKSPSFLLRATKDPDAANLDRIQIIKGWLDASGELHETIYNVALSDDRTQDSDGSVEPVGNTVNTDDGTYTNTIGDAELSATWTDPDFNAEERAFYYARVLEIPTPRWGDWEKLNTPRSPELPMVIVERAYTSPIWYTP